MEGYIEHKSDEMKLPEGAIILERKTKVVRDVVSKIVEHHFEILNYLHTFWKQLFAYRNDGEYTINTFISTCRQVGVSFRDYFRRLMKELGTGRTDYENLLPMTIGL